MADDEASADEIPTNITQLAERKVRLAKAQAEIDRILNCPIDPPFDAESELKKVVSISPPLIAENSVDYAHEEQISEMEEDLYQAVRQQDYARAAEQEKVISQKHIDDCGLVLQANSKFYDAFSKKDPAAMESVWLQDRSSICIHPSFKPLVGAKDIMNNWHEMFESSNGSFQRSWMEPHAVRIVVKATTAIITCEEHVFTRRFVRGQKRETELVNKLQATNIFRRIGGKWYLSYHHSSWHADSDAAKVALKHSKGEGKHSKGEDKNENGAKKEEAPPAINNILGSENVGPMLGGENADGESKDGQKKVIMGSLSDLLNGKLGDLGGGSDGNAEPGGFGLGDIFGGDNMGPGKAIIQVREFNPADGTNDGSNGFDSPMKALEQWAKDDDSNSNGTSKKELRKQCIELLRKLASDGRISQRQKRILQSDIISCTAKGEPSQIEVAFELLCAESEGDDDAEEDFADQCHILADKKYE